MKNRITLALVSLVFMSSCSNPDKIEDNTVASTHDELNKAYFLLGEWRNATPEGVFMEAWKKQNDSVYSGHSYLLNEKDTAFSETIRLEQRKNELFYIPIVKDQNGGQAVEFKLTSASPTQVVFENPQHDFPSKITYTFLNKDSLVAEISGSMNGKANSQLFPMTRVK